MAPVAKAVDYSDHTEPHPTVSALRAAGVSGVLRYLIDINMANGDKTLYIKEARRLSDGGISLASIMETTAGMMRRGREGGLVDGPAALKAARAVGMPARRPIYYAADTGDTTPAQAISYLVAVREKTGPPVGVYGSYYVLKGVYEYWAVHFPGERVFLWQTPAWSGGNEFGPRDLRQLLPFDQNLDGTSVDYNDVYHADWGQWRILPAPACLAALRQMTAEHPDRNKVSDGILGDAAHLERTSDHNIGNAFDLTHDPAHGVDTYALADWLRQECLAGREKRVTYIISNSRIASGTSSTQFWTWRPYTGSNPHTGHMHVSIRFEARDDVSDWWDFSMALSDADVEKIAARLKAKDVRNTFSVSHLWWLRSALANAESADMTDYEKTIVHSTHAELSDMFALADDAAEILDAVTMLSGGRTEDTAKILAAIAALSLGQFPEAALEAIKKAVADELDRRASARLAVVVP